MIGRVRGAVFDFDGVLVDSEPLHFAALRDSLAPEDIALGESEYAARYLAYSDREAIRLVLEDRGIPFDAIRIDAIALRKADLFGAGLAEIPLFPGARELVRALSALVPIGIASGARRPEIEAILAAAGLREAFSVIVGAEDVDRGKPDPQPYLTAAAGLRRRAPQLEPADCVAFEDSMAGIASARAAGMTVVAVTNSYPAGRLTAAHQVVASLAEVSLAGLAALTQD